jgi:hypothetical protein
MLFSYKATYKVATWYTPYQLVYGLHALMPTEYKMPVVRGNQKDNTSMRVFKYYNFKIGKVVGG